MIYNIKMVIADETKWVAWGACRVIKVFGFNNHTADSYIQFHAKPAAAIANGDVPAVASLYAPTAAPTGWDFSANPISLSELSVAISSTEVNYTALTNQGCDITIVVETDCPVTSATTIAGDLTTGVDDRQIWADSAGPKRLLRLDIINNNAATVYPLVFAQDLPDSNVDDPIFGPSSILTTATGTYFFGRDGLSKFNRTAENVAYADGCTVKLGTNPIKDYDFVAGNDFNIRGIYE